MIHPINVRLVKSEVARVEQAAALRYQLARASGVEDKLIDTSRGGEEADLPGLKAEVAVAKLMDAEFNATTLGLDNGCDLYLQCGAKEVGVQVKSTHHIGGKWLLGTPHAKHNWDVAVFVRPTDKDSVMQVYGWIRKADYEEKLEKVDLGHGPGDGVSIDHLRSMEELWREINEKRSS
jgi:hypothetical protein